MNLDFTGKCILVTGGTRGIGRGIVEAFLEAGARVAVNGSTDESTAKAVSELDAGDRVVAAPGSVGEVAGCNAVVAAAVEGLGGLDVLVNNAGRGGGGTIEDIDEELWDRVLDTNLKGTFFTIKAAIPHLRASKGNIVNIASVNGMTGVMKSTAYGPSKAGVINMTKCLAQEFAPDVRVNAICPGGVDTDMLQNLAVRKAGNVPDGYEIIAADCPQGRISDVSELAKPVLFYASDAASFATGSIIAIDGGETA
ncbi:MAG: SDR family oxidoreductase [Rhodospirillaceae bacterium]|jgi:NAD(P)-dependent dehydrogenase (short-subunit alcohol dehydrogenase family)|nr:SDR family oxidoreductase [Rhodospirillaceae bacterium]MBT6204081.1 SDR family oxidoreductase [Rhodospirillaceae bacterium]MBT7648338.1 SDR family oxidoreductase [Rhodospirillaceae bacterium]